MQYFFNGIDLGLNWIRRAQPVDDSFNDGNATAATSSSPGIGGNGFDCSCTFENALLNSRFGHAIASTDDRTSRHE